MFTLNFCNICRPTPLFSQDPLHLFDIFTSVSALVIVTLVRILQNFSYLQASYSLQVAVENALDQLTQANQVKDQMMATLTVGVFSLCYASNSQPWQIGTWQDTPQRNESFPPVESNLQTKMFDPYVEFMLFLYVDTSAVVYLHASVATGCPIAT